MSLDELLKSLEEKEASIQANLTQVTANHNALLGMLKGVQECTEVAKNLANKLVPGSALAEGLELADNIADAVGELVDSITSEAQNG